LLSFWDESKNKTRTAWAVLKYCGTKTVTPKIWKN